MSRKFKNIRIFLLLSVLLFVSIETWLAKSRSTDWQQPLWLIVYPINGDGSAVTSNYIERLNESRFDSIEKFFVREADKFGVEVDDPVTVELAPEVDELPPQPPANGNVLSVIFWSLKMRYWAYSHDTFDGPRPDVKMFVIYHDPAKKSRLHHSLGLQKGMLGVVNAFASRRMTATNNVIIAHEFLHTVGALDKYDIESNQPMHPIGIAEPERVPLYPQNKAEVMGGRIALSATQSSIPSSLNQVVVGKTTALEIQWLNE